MLVTAILCLWIGLAHAQVYDSNTCGLRPLKPSGDDDDKIVGGVQSLRGDWPWSCSMRVGQRHICGGSLINNKWIVSAAHCSTNTNPAQYRWLCGIHERLKNETYSKEFRTSRVINHPQYNSRLIRNDISLFELTETVTYTDWILPVCYPDAAQTYENQQSIATGWGTLTSGGTVAANHMEVQMPVLTDAACKTKYNGANNMLDVPTQICAGVTGENKDTCQGDSGGPLVVKHSDNLWYLAGLTSWGYGCGDGGVYTRNSAFRAWVESYTGPLPTGK